MIVVLAAGSTPQLHLQPGRVDPGDDRLHRRPPRPATSRPARSTTRRSSRSAPLLFVMTLVMNVIASGSSAGTARSTSDGRPAPTAPRNRLAVAGARATTQAMLQRPAARRRDPQHDLRRRCCCSRSLIALAGLLALLIQAFVEGRVGAQPRPAHQPALDRVPREGRLPPGDHRLALADRRRDPLHRPDRGRRRALPRGVRRQDALVEPADRGQHPEPRRGAFDHLRHPRPRLHRPRPARPRLHPRSPAR